MIHYHRITPDELQKVDAFFEAAEVLPVTWPIIVRAAAIRRDRRMSLGDSLMAATALLHDLTLVTNDTADFKGVEGLRLLNPFEEAAP